MLLLDALGTLLVYKDFSAHKSHNSLVSTQNWWFRK